MLPGGGSASWHASGWRGGGSKVLDLVLQLGPCRVEPVGRRLLRVRGGSDQPEVVAAIRRAGGERDGTRAFWWIEARQLRGLAAVLRRASDPLLRASQ
jgi:hypothetical protein